MGLSKLGNYIALFEKRNSDNKYDVNAVVGLSTQKKMIKTKADLDGVSLTSYKIMPPNSFAYVPDTSRRGDKISLAFNSTDRTFLVSSISVTFTVKNLKELSADYLFMYFNRPEFDRYARFNSWGSAREAFSWDDMCDIEIELPPLPIQQKYVAVYKAMLANQNAYETGLEDLRLACDGYFDLLKKEKNLIYQLGLYIERVDKRNIDCKYSQKDVRGITNKKEFADTKADITNTDLTKFIEIGHNAFAYNSRTDGRDMLVLAINREKQSIIVTWNYNAFRIREDCIHKLNPEYLYAFLKRTEFDRLVRFMSWGSSQELFSWESLTEIEIPLPEITIQNAIAHINNVFVERNKINEQLKLQIKDLCPILIKGSLEEAKN